jgi:hypothetical protein
MTEKSGGRSSRDLSEMEWALKQIEEALCGLQFGQVTVSVQDGVVIQLERTERKRIRPANKK